MSSVYDDAAVLERVLKLASENASNPKWPAHLKPDAIQAEANKVYSLWNRIWIAVANAANVRNRDGHYETTYTTTLGPGGSTSTRSDTTYVVDRFDSTPGPYKTTYREYLDITFKEVSRLDRNFKDNSLGSSPDKLKAVATAIRRAERDRMDRRCCGLGFYYNRYIVPILKFFW